MARSVHQDNSKNNILLITRGSPAPAFHWPSVTIGFLYHPVHLLDSGIGTHAFKVKGSAIGTFPRHHLGELLQGISHQELGLPDINVVVVITILIILVRITRVLVH
jgi:hypothetical protein